MNTLAAIASAVVGVAAALVATTFELLPDKVTPASFVLQTAGLVAILATALALLEQRRRPPDRRAAPLRPYAEYGTIAGAVLGAAIFLLLFIIQEVS